MISLALALALCGQQESAEKITHSFLVAGEQTYLVNSDDSIGADGTRNFIPFRSSGALTGLVDVVTLRKPLSQALDIVSRPTFSIRFRPRFLLTGQKRHFR